MTFSPTQSVTEIEFVEAAQCWQLEKLYLDLAEAKGKGLTPLEKKFLQGLLCGYSPAEIAERVYQSRTSSAVRVYLSNGIYKYLQQLLISKLGRQVKINSWSRVTYLLEKAGYRKKDTFSAQISPLISLEQSAGITLFWEEKLEIPDFVGRERELTQLKEWILAENCRLVAVLGMAGIGKTTLVVKLVEQIQDQFELIIWRSLRDAPAAEDLITEIIITFSRLNGQDMPLNMSPISYLLGLLRSHRCLLILNQFEQVFAARELCGHYRRGYEKYGELLRRLGEEQHLSRCLLTSSEEPPDMDLWTENHSSIQRLYLGELATTHREHLLKTSALIGSAVDYNHLVSICVNNTLVFKKITLVIKRYFDGKISDFLAADTLLFPEICTWLDSRFSRLSDTEQYVMYWLAVNQQLQANKGGNLSLELAYLPELTVLASLKRRSLITLDLNFTEPLWKPYLLEKLFKQSNITDNFALAKIIKQILGHTLA
jgi:hypothetical protein